MCVNIKSNSQQLYSQVSSADSIGPLPTNSALLSQTPYKYHPPHLLICIPVFPSSTSSHSNISRHSYRVNYDREGDGCWISPLHLPLVCICHHIICQKHHFNPRYTSFLQIILFSMIPNLSMHLLNQLLNHDLDTLSNSLILTLCVFACTHQIHCTSAFLKEHIALLLF